MNILKLGSLKDAIRKYREKRQKQKKVQNQTCNVWCTCGAELISSGSCQIDYLGEDGLHNVVYFKCKSCSTKSYYNFDVAPVPIPWTSMAEVKEKIYPNGFGFLDELVSARGTN